ncbi:hypothetical protein ALQ37_03146 [Pseudomonas syringae pv. aptata]|uniref:Uncharacterized protein n=3 Tax=Pseudomonas syringae group TaxID=136849 RepID=Q88BJ3_PSESM|nr:hypothetical protein [Pseudomonas syringae group genomosp. 3]AAO53569.1 protein of unknown function [Pseudomonas syringae pv. tomato str. DC3000]KPZ04840.1 Uncharacterized protein ALO85_01514 [Pseudomonas syringae pv. aptata]RML14310.1 hypothetical protein APX70_200018 [Pseudomonas syringae pv. maculicola]RMO64197.1 hypothetical protein ALQ37_03146 [Pseudomonas syringae pv. aptata]
MDREYHLVRELLEPGRRQRDEARARIRSMLAMESIAVEEVEVSERDIDRIEKAVRAGQGIKEVFPRLSTVGTRTDGEGVNLLVHFTKKEGAPIRYIGGDDPAEAAAVRELDLQKKFYLGAADLAQKVGLTLPKASALRAHLGVDEDVACRDVFEFGSTRIPRFSDNAFRRMREALATVDIEDVWRARQR